MTISRATYLDHRRLALIALKQQRRYLMRVAIEFEMVTLTPLNLTAFKCFRRDQLSAGQTMLLMLRYAYYQGMDDG